jgi:hypothetical protein
VVIVHVILTSEHPRNLAGSSALRHLHPQPKPRLHPRTRIQSSQWHSRGKPPVSRTPSRFLEVPKPLSSEELTLHSYNRYIAVASRVVRRSLKDEKRIIAEKRGESELRFAKWDVSAYRLDGGDGTQGGC